MTTAASEECRDGGPLSSSRKRARGSPSSSSSCGRPPPYGAQAAWSAALHDALLCVPACVPGAAEQRQVVSTLREWIRRFATPPSPPHSASRDSNDGDDDNDGEEEEDDDDEYNYRADDRDARSRAQGGGRRPLPHIPERTQL
jgi:hypothetical protein